MDSKPYKLVYDRKSGKDKRVYVKVKICIYCCEYFKQRKNFNYKECPKCRKQRKSLKK